MTTRSATTHVLLGVAAYRRLIHEDAMPPKDVADVVAATASGASDLPLSGFRVLCRFDAYADYVAHVEADSAEEAAGLANDNHEKYNWEPMGTTEFDAKSYVTLDEDDNEIEATEIRNY